MVQITAVPFGTNHSRFGAADGGGHQPPYRTEAELAEELHQAGFSHVDVARFWYRGDSDGSFQALKYQPELLLEAAATQSLAVFKRMPESDLKAGVEALRRDSRTGHLQEVVAVHQPMLDRYGDGVVVSAWRLAV